MLNELRNFINLPTLSEESISKHPARKRGWFATIPTFSPKNLEKPITMFLAQCSWISKKLLS